MIDENLGEVVRVEYYWGHDRLGLDLETPMWSVGV